MIKLQLLSKVINSSDTSILENNNIDKLYFDGYEDEYDFIMTHKSMYGVAPDKATFLAKFPAFEILDVQEPDAYLIDGIREEYLYKQTLPILQRAAEFMKSDSNAAVEYLVSSMSSLQPNYKLSGIDLIKDAQVRYDQFVEMKSHPDKHFFTTGLQELDDLIHGLQRGEELLVIYARTNQGKSWILEKMCTHVWQIGYNVGYISPEMGANSIGYRFDTLNKNFSNNGLKWGKDSVDSAEYENYISDLQTRDNRFIVSTPSDFNNTVTVSKIKNWAIANKLDLIAVDGISYLTDERGKRSDNKTTSLTDISEDLMALSIELKVPILVVVQANRGGIVEKGSSDTPELENIKDSDGIAHNASKALAIHQKEPGVLIITVKKYRDGPVNGTLTYDWNIDTGEFTWIPTNDDAVDTTTRNEKMKEIKASYNDATDVF